MMRQCPVCQRTGRRGRDGPAHPASWHVYARKELFELVNLSPSCCHVPDGMAADLDAMVDFHLRAIELAGGIDLQIIGSVAMGT